MTKRKPKISYRDLVRPEETTPEVPEGAEPPAAPEPPSASGAVAPDVVPAPSVPAVPPVERRGTYRQPDVAPGSAVSIASALNAGAKPIPVPERRKAAAPAAPSVPAPAPAPAAPSAAPIAKAEALSRSDLVKLPLAQRLAAGAATDMLRFRVGRERFAVALSSVEEAVEVAEVHAVPEAARDQLGVFMLRGRLVPVYSPARALGVTLAADAQALLVVPWRDRRVALRVDEVDDVFTLAPGALRPAPGTDDPDGVLLGVSRQDGALVAVLDVPALLAACFTDPAPATV